MNYLYILLALLFTLFANPVFAQLSDYWGTAGGTVNASFLDDKINTYVDIGASIEVGKVIADQAILGAGLDLGTTIVQSKTNAKDRFSSSTTGLNLFLQYYFYQEDKWAVYVRPSYAFSKIYNTAEAIGLGSSGDRIDYWRVGLGGGVNYFIQPNIAIQGMADFSLIERLTADGVSFSGGLRPELNVGLQFFTGAYDPAKIEDPERVKKALVAEAWTVGGGVSWRNREAGSNELRISPSIAYFNLDRVAFGFEFSGTYQLQDSTNQLQIIPFLRYYLPLKNQYFVIEGGGGLSLNKVPILVDGERSFDVLSDLVGQGKIALGIFMSQQTALQGGLRYQYLLPITNEIDPANAYFSVGLEIGIQYFFGSKLSASNTNQ
ncbi:MAG: outer membrane beta-barrel protein [Bacteroidota bacterium]